MQKQKTWYAGEVLNPNAPPEIRTPKDIYDFVEGLPAESFCADIRHDGKGRCCILGHLENHYVLDDDFNREPPTDGFNMCQLATVNNGLGTTAFDYRRYIRKDGDISGPAIKDRLLSFLRLYI